MGSKKDSKKVEKISISRAALVIIKGFILREKMPDLRLLNIVEGILSNPESRREGFVIFEYTQWYSLTRDQYFKINGYISNIDELKGLIFRV